MISRRLTKIQKDEILEAYQAGENTNKLAKKYSCSSNTINRTVKSLLSDVEYKLLKQQRSKSGNKNSEHVNVESSDGAHENFDHQNYLCSPQSKINEEMNSIGTDHDCENSNFDQIAFLPIEDLPPAEPENLGKSEIKKTIENNGNDFQEIVPLISSFDFEKKQLDFQILNHESLPESVYMLVDKKVELEVKAISDIPEWGFLPEDELKRNAIILFSNQRSAKRSCSKNQRVIKIPNTSVFEVSKSYLVLKGITRLILEESIIALDS
tara:strand:+ start:288 stop:1088 length:801 start_codon:yes stop_codon:yes gene_type:complete